MTDSGGFEHKFIDPPDDLVCLVCHHVAKDAHQVECCGKVFCKSCITEVNRRLGTCPNCRVESPKIFSDIRGAREIKRLKVACENEDKGCDWSGPLESYNETHKEECGFNEVKCPNSGCSEMILKRFLDEHSTTTCPRRRVQCEVCSYMVAYEDMDTHRSTKCPKVKIECTNSSCTIKLFRDELAVHQCVCPKQKIDCPYSEVGCTAQILREDRQKHLLENVEQHATIATNTNVSLKRELHDVSEKLTDAKCLVPPVTFKMTNYRQKKEEKKVWHSPMFYSHPRGYKMNLKACVAGDDDKGYLAVFCYLFPGHNDDNLDWPFSNENSITIQILNQSRDLKHHVINFNWNHSDEEVRKKPDAFVSCGWGLDQFISHSDLERVTNSYVKNDCVYFRVSKVTIAKSWLTCSA